MADKHEMIGPKLPPHLQKSTGRDNDDRLDENDEHHHVSIESASSASSMNKTSDQQDIFGPVLPPGLENKGNKATDIAVGPALPPGWNRERNSDSEGEDETVIGPLPSTSCGIENDSQMKYEIESRARAMKDKLLGKNKESAPKREVWMTELPPELGANIGIVARTFKKRNSNTSESDRSVWTDTPADRERKLKDRMMKKSDSEKFAEPVKRQRDIEMKKRIEDHNTQYRSSSLMEMHQGERKKKKDDGPTERRPFDRSTDLDLRKIDRKATNTFIKSAKGMNSKFENPKFESKYL